MYTDMPCELMYAQLIGTLPLPWEAGAQGAEARNQQLGTLHRLVIPCLDRSFQDRPDVESLLRGYWHFCDMHAMHQPQQRYPPSTVFAGTGTGTGSTHHVFNTFYTVSSRGGATISTAVPRTCEERCVCSSRPAVAEGVGVGEPSQRSQGASAPSPLPAVPPLEDSTAMLDSAALDVAVLQTMQQSSASVPLGDESQSQDMMLPVLPAAAAPRLGAELPAGAGAGAHTTSTSKSAVRKWAEGSAQALQGVFHGGVEEAAARRVHRRVSSAYNASGSDGEHAKWTSASDSVRVASLIEDGSVTVMGGSAERLPAATANSTATSPDRTRDERASDSKTKTTGTPAASVEMCPVLGDEPGSAPSAEELTQPPSDSAAGPMRLR